MRRAVRVRARMHSPGSWPCHARRAAGGSAAARRERRAARRRRRRRPAPRQTARLRKRRRCCAPARSGRAGWHSGTGPGRRPAATASSTRRRPTWRVVRRGGARARARARLTHAGPPLGSARGRTRLAREKQSHRATDGVCVTTAADSAGCWLEGLAWCSATKARWATDTGVGRARAAAAASNDARTRWPAGAGAGDRRAQRRTRGAHDDVLLAGLRH